MTRAMAATLLMAIGSGLSGCAAQMEKSAVRQLEAQCAAQGLRFEKLAAKRTEAVVVSQSSVSGQCVPLDAAAK
jgi:hypothetical protein